MRSKWVNRLIALSMTVVMAESMIGCGARNDTSSATNEAAGSEAGGTVDDVADTSDTGTG